MKRLSEVTGLPLQWMQPRAFAALDALVAGVHLLVFKPWQRRWRAAERRFSASCAEPLALGA